MGSSLVLRLVIGKEASRVDALYLRISLCYKILDGTKLYKDLHKLVDTAAKKLKKELGPLDRRFRNCVRLLLKFTTTLAPSHTSTLSFSTSHQYDDHLFENFLGCRVWHQECSSKSYPEKKLKICNLNPSTEYMCMVSLFSCTQVYGTWEAKWLTPSNKTVDKYVMSNQYHSQLN
ncbi:hypothetical protein V2J09_004380 [Rumex salicifolius]